MSHIYIYAIVHERQIETSHQGYGHPFGGRKMPPYGYLVFLENPYAFTCPKKCSHVTN
jgi:hypothetical protein